MFESLIVLFSESKNHYFCKKVCPADIWIRKFLEIRPNFRSIGTFTSTELKSSESADRCKYRDSIERESQLMRKPLFAHRQVRQLICILHTELVFLNVYGAQESISRNEFRQPMLPGGPVR